MSAQSRQYNMSEDPVATFVIRPVRPDDVVRDPVTRKPLARDGEPKPRNSHWLRRRAVGDVVEVPAGDAKIVGRARGARSANCDSSKSVPAKSGKEE